MCIRDSREAGVDVDGLAVVAFGLVRIGCGVSLFQVRVDVGSVLRLPVGDPFRRHQARSHQQLQLSAVRIDLNPLMGSRPGRWLHRLVLLLHRGIRAVRIVTDRGLNLLGIVSGPGRSEAGVGLLAVLGL